MTTELEKQFFEAFGIEPIAEYCKHQCNNELDESACIGCKYIEKVEYPQITDRILLYLIRIIGFITIKYTNEQCEICYSDGAISYLGKDLKEAILNFLISKVSIFKHQVQAIFEGKR